MAIDVTRRALFAAPAVILPAAAETAMADKLRRILEAAPPFFGDRNFAVIQRDEIEALLRHE